MGKHRPPQKRRDDRPQTVAPAEMLRLEMRMLQDREVLRTSLEVEGAIFMQSLVGRSHEGSGTFAGRRFVDTSEDDVALALRLDPLSVRRGRQALIDEIGDFARRVIAGERPERLLTEDGRPLLDFSPFRFLSIDAAAVLGGIYLGGMRDTQEVRLEAEACYGVNIGTGGMFFVNTETMRRIGLNGDALAHGEHASDIDRFRDEGLITDEQPSPDNPVSYMYIRHHRGPGASDDAAISIAGKLHGVSVAAGVFLADAIDTLEKYVPSEDYDDQDAALAREIETDFASLSVRREDALALTFLSRGADDVPDSSLRHLLRVDRSVDQCAAEAFLLYSAGLPCGNIGLGHERVPVHRFFRAIEARLAASKIAGGSE